MEVHPDPDRALCDGPNSWPLARVEELLTGLLAIHRVAAPYNGTAGEGGDGR
jgi:2-dehydro-3-deoxyphosphooctonate aldolase (KDO 8-P synthase)